MTVGVVLLDHGERLVDKVFTRLDLDQIIVDPGCVPGEFTQARDVCGEFFVHARVAPPQAQDRLSRFYGRDESVAGAGAASRRAETLSVRRIG